jgi:hypothetical protein
MPNSKNYMNLSKTKRSSQTMDNFSFDEEYLQNTVLIVGEHENTLVRLKLGADGSIALATEDPTDIEGGGAVTIGTTAVNLTFTGTTHSIILTASQSNTGIIYIGKSTVTSAGANALTFLMPGESLTLDYNDTTNALYAVSDTASQSLFKGATL